MHKKRPPSKKPSGGKRMTALGYKPIQLWVDREDMATLREASTKDGRPLTRFVLRAALAAAQQLIWLQGQ